MVSGQIETRLRLAWLAELDRELTEADLLYREAQRMARGAPGLLAEAHEAIGAYAERTGERDGRMKPGSHARHYRLALSYYREAADHRGAARMHRRLADLALSKGRRGQAMNHLRMARVRYRLMGDLRAEASLNEMIEGR
jgi:hypothetical protein